MSDEAQINAFVDDLALPSPSSGPLARAGEDVADMGALPTLVVAGSNIIEFADEVPASMRSTLAGALLLAQLHADHAEPKTLAEWYDTYTTTLSRLGLGLRDQSRGTHEFSGASARVHEAIIPLIALAFGEAAAAASLIIKTLEQLKDKNPSKRWITLLDKRSRRLDAADYQFAIVKSKNGEPEVLLVGASLSGEILYTEVLFFSFSTAKSTLEVTRANMSADPALLARINPKIQERVEAYVDGFIAEVKLPPP